jgi:hypothetical protein
MRERQRGKDETMKEGKRENIPEGYRRSGGGAAQRRFPVLHSEGFIN